MRGDVGEDLRPLGAVSEVMGMFSQILQRLDVVLRALRRRCCS